VVLSFHIQIEDLIIVSMVYSYFQGDKKLLSELIQIISQVEYVFSSRNMIDTMNFIL
jgi:hypothetical protein